MKRKFHCIERKLWRNRGLSLLAAICLLLGLTVITSCNETLTPDQFKDPMSRDLTLRFYLPGVAPSTKAAVGPINSVSPESQIYNVKVWVFNHADPNSAAADDEIAIAYSEANGINWANTQNLPNGSKYYTAEYWADAYTLEVNVNFPGYIVGRAADNMKFDFYVLANAPSIFTDAKMPNRLSKRGDLKTMTFGYTADSDDLFGPWQLPRATWGNNPTTAINGTSETGPGLPISGFFNKDKDGNPNGVDLSFLKDNRPSWTAEEVAEILPIVQLQRAVSKIRFFFAKPNGMSGVSVTKIEILENQIPARTFVFPREDGTPFELPATDDGVTYVAKAAEFSGPGNNDIVEIADPESLKSSSDTYSSATAQEYEAALNTAMGTKTNTQRYVYLRETDKALTCRIHYKMSDSATAEEQVKEFTLDPADGTSLYRNHYWTVYAYFLGGKLFVNPTEIADWIDAEELTYTLKMNTNMRLFDSWLYRYDTDGDYTDYTKWATSHMAVSSGRATASTVEPVAGRPLRSPQVQLVTTGTGTFELTVDNDDFEIIRANKNDIGVVTSYEASTNGVLTIPVGDDVYTYFYIVPKEGVTPSNPEAKVSLIYNDPVLGPQKVTFNSNALPGYSDDSSEIWAYYFSTDEYNINGKLKMYFQDYNHPLVPTPVQN